MDKNVKCTSPDCDCIEIAEIKNGGNPVKSYECLAGTKKICKESGCNKVATKDYNDHGHWVCDRHYEILNRFFEEEYR